MAMSPALCLVVVISAVGISTASVSPDEYYPYIRPESYNLPGRRYYPDNYDFTDYSAHFTRSDASSRNSAAEPPPSGPYFAHELKSYYHNRQKIYQTSWNMIDSDGNDYSPYHRPAPPPPEPPIRPELTRKPMPSKKPIRKNKNKKRPPVQHQHQPGAVGGPHYQKHPNNLEKVSDIVGAQSIASAYPNGVMGTLSLMAGLVWYLVNKSATPVVKMREAGRTDDDDALPSSGSFTHNEVMEQWWSSLKETECQQRAVCELVSESSFLGSATRWSKSVFRGPMMQKVMKTLKEEPDQLRVSEKDASKLAMIFRAASVGERGVDCAAFYPHCSLPFRLEARDR